MIDLLENLVYSAIAEWEYARGWSNDEDKISSFAKEFSKKWKENQEKLGGI